MNIAVINKIAYKIFPEGNITELNFIPYTCKISSTPKKTSGNNFFETTVSFKIENVNPDTTSQLKKIAYRKAQFKFTDANLQIHVIGSELYPARFTFIPKIDGTPGSFNGYLCKILHLSPTGIDYEVL